MIVRGWRTVGAWFLERVRVLDNLTVEKDVGVPVAELILEQHQGCRDQNKPD